MCDHTKHPERLPAIRLFQIVTGPELDNESLIVTTAEGLLGVRLNPGVDNGFLVLKFRPK